MYHSVTIGRFNTYDDWKLVPDGRPVIAAPKPRTNLIDVFSVDGLLDMSAALTGERQFENREGELTFYILNQYAGYQYASKHHEIMNYLHGQSLELTLEDDPGYFYKGLFEVSWNPDKDWSKLSIQYNLNPWKYERNSSLDDWLWDSFDFEHGIVREYKNLRVNGLLTLHIPASKRQQVPKINVSGNGLTVSVDGVTYPLSNGVNRNVNIVLGTADKNLIFSGNGTVSVEYQGGWL